MADLEFPTRRAFLTGSTGVVAVAALAACGGGSDGAREGGNGGGVVPSAESGTELAKVSQVPVDGALAVTVDSKPALVTQPTEGQFAAFSAICTHNGCTVQPGDGELKCPCHASRFDLATGAVLGGPAPKPLPEIEVTVSGGAITVA